jgi:sulfite reductase (ferredoxin)
MQRIKIPFGGLNPDQMDTLADLAEEYSDSVLHITTRQDFQFHFVHIDDTPALMRRLAAVGITTREACGNSIRNVTLALWPAFAGLKFDVVLTQRHRRNSCRAIRTPRIRAKFKIAFSGCEAEACGLVNMHDLAPSL